jgi:hemerythrin
MPTLEWSDSLALQQPHMDATHLEFVQCLAALEAAALAAPLNTKTLGAALAALQHHTETHFAQEEAWMAHLGFDADNCHGQQHQGVLEVVQEVARRHAIQPDAELALNVVKALAQWFPGHAAGPDAALAQILRETGLDPDSFPAQAPAQTTGAHGCGAGCGPAEVSANEHGHAEAQPASAAASTPHEMPA